MGETRMFLVPARMVSEFYRDLDVKERNGDQHGGIYGLWKPVSRARCEELAARGKSRTLRMVTDTDPGKTCSFTIVGGRSTEDRFFRKTGRAKAIPDTGAAKSARPGRRRSPTITETPDPNIPF